MGWACLSLKLIEKGIIKKKHLQNDFFGQFEVLFIRWNEIDVRQVAQVVGEREVENLIKCRFLVDKCFVRTLIWNFLTMKYSLEALFPSWILQNEHKVDKLKSSNYKCLHYFFQMVDQFIMWPKILTFQRLERPESSLNKNGRLYIIFSSLLLHIRI